MKYDKLALLAIALFLLAGCTTPAPTYRFANASPTDPEISFESDFELHTRFAVNTKEPEGQMCSNFDSVGYLLKANSIFIYDRPNTTITIKAPANKPISVSAHHSFSDPGYRANCGPLTQVFTPFEGKKYVAKLNLVDKLCYLSVASVEPDGQRIPVSSRIVGRCY